MDGLSDADRDAIVAALLTMPLINSKQSPEARMEAYHETFAELMRWGGTARFHEHARSKAARER